MRCCAVFEMYNKVTQLHIHVCCALSRVPLFVTPWTVAHKAPLSMAFSRQVYWSGVRKVRQGGSKDSLGAISEPDVQLEIDTESSGKSRQPEWAP